MMKKVLSLLLVFVVVFSLFSVTASAAQSKYYTDVSTTDSFYNATTYLYEHGIMVGVGNNRFNPNGTMTRAQAVTILWRMAGSPICSGSMPFTDCKTSAYYYNAVKWACNQKITAGTSATTFTPDREVTQQETFTFLYKFMCDCGYISDSAQYLTLFNASPLTKKATIADWAKRPVGWAYNSGILTDKSICGTAKCSRSQQAVYVYSIFKKYQKKYALTVVNTNDMSYASDCGKAMQTLFKHYNASVVSKTDIKKADFSSAMSTAFKNAKTLDICYLFCQCHGSENGLCLFTNSGSSKYLTPSYLRSEIDKYKGTFVALLSGCHTGTYVTKGVNAENVQSSSVQLEEASDEFDPDFFVSVLTEAAESGDLAGSNRIKAICSSEKTELSYYSLGNATKYWCLGAGYDLENKTYTALYADTNSDKRVSLQELYIYARAKVLQKHPTQHMVCSPKNDSSIIFEKIW